MSILTVTFISFYALGFWSLQQYGSLCYEVHQTIYERVFVQTAFQRADFIHLTERALRGFGQGRFCATLFRF